MTEPRYRVVVGLGSNLGDRRAHLLEAVHELGRWVPLKGVSDLYESEPWAGIEQPDYLNAALALDVEISLPELLEHLQGLEIQQGRIRAPAAPRWASRTLDLDILWAGKPASAGFEPVRLHTEDLSVPHQGLQERAFALLPLLDLIPDALDAESGERWSSRVARLKLQRIQRVADPAWPAHWPAER